MNVSTTPGRRQRRIPLVLFTVLVACCLVACASRSGERQGEGAGAEGAAGSLDTKSFIVTPLDEPDTCDFQCTTIHYTIALNVFDRLVETQVGEDGVARVHPSLARSWEISDDGLTYTFHLRDDVTFSNGSRLTASDVHYTLVRLLSHPNASNQDLAREIVGAKELEAGEADDLAGFRIVNDHTFKITLEQPFYAFMACLSMPGASILDEESTEAAGERFGKDPEATVGTGPFVMAEWRHGDRILLAANPTCWSGVPSCKGVDLRFVYDPEKLDRMFRDGKIDVMNVDDLSDQGEYYLHGEAYASQVKTAPHVGIDYIALNESVKPLDDVRVRKALQLALNRDVLLRAALGGSGTVENGIFPHGLLGFNPDLPAIPYNPDQARELLGEAGYADGFGLEISMRPTSTMWQRQLMDMVATMWGRVGVRAHIRLLGDDEFMDRRIKGELACYTASWAADFDDPDNFVYTFFGTRDNTVSRSLCYGNEEMMDRVWKARSIKDEQARMAEYDELERIIVQEDAAWVPLFSRERHFLVSERLDDFATMWNGWFEGTFRDMSIRD